MKIRVQRKIEVYPRFQNKFLNVLVADAEKFFNKTNVYPDIFVNLYKNASAVEVRIFTDFDSLAEYEEIFLHKVLKDTKYLDVAEGLVDMIVDEPQDEMYVRMDVEDVFMNRKHKVKPGKNLDLSQSAKLNKGRATFRTEREYCASKGRLADVMKMNFDFAEKFKIGTGHGVDYFCTRFSAARIGCSKIFWDSDECPQCASAFLQQDQEIAVRFEGLLKAPPMTTVYRRVDAELLAFDLNKAVR
jgi:hypothetical protein